MSRLKPHSQPGKLVKNQYKYPKRNQVFWKSPLSINNNKFVKACLKSLLRKKSQSKSTGVFNRFSKSLLAYKTEIKLTIQNQTFPPKWLKKSKNKRLWPLAVNLCHPSKLTWYLTTSRMTRTVSWCRRQPKIRSSLTFETPNSLTQRCNSHFNTSLHYKPLNHQPRPR